MTAAQQLQALVRVHPAGQEAWPHVLKTWLLSYSQSAFARQMRGGIFHRHHHALAEKLLTRGSLHVVSPLDCESQYCAWALTEPGVLHYVFTKPDYRKMGFARMLLAALPQGFSYTHCTREGMRLVKPPAIYNPYLALGEA